MKNQTFFEIDTAGTLFFSKNGIETRFYVITHLNREFKPSFIVDKEKN